MIESYIYIYMPIFASWSLKKIPRNEVEPEAKVKFEGYMLYRIFPHVKDKIDISKPYSPDP